VCIYRSTSERRQSAGVSVSQRVPLGRLLGASRGRGSRGRHWPPPGGVAVRRGRSSPAGAPPTQHPTPGTYNALNMAAEMVTVKLFIFVGHLIS